MPNSLSASDKILLFPFWLLTLMPLKALYVLSDFLFIITFYIVRYRRKVVSTNLKNSFPEKNQKELKRIERGFYRFLTDYFIESIYIINMSITECHRRYIFTNPEILTELYHQGVDIIVGTAHYGNWEWAFSSADNIPYKCLGVYRPLSNKLFDRFFVYLRSKYGGYPIPVRDTLREIIEAKNKNERFALYLVGDQRPIKEDLDFWSTFLNQDTPVITGIDRLSRKFNTPVYYMRIERIKRGQYSITYELITDRPNEEKELAIAERFIRKVEDTIVKQPEYWLWSHKRWRYRPEEFKPGFTE
jgi:Kdo2-lipid IVA lauroyltransferase/acyltransferase